MKNLTKEKIKKLVEEESINWLLTQFTCDEEDIFASEALKEIFDDRDIELSKETLNYIVELYLK